MAGQDEGRPDGFLCPEGHLLGSQSLEAEEYSGLGRERRDGEGDGGTSTSRSVTQAEEEFSKAQGVFEDLNQELLEELPVLYNR